MKLKDLRNLASPPPLFAEFDNIPWHEPSFSERMLGEHLDQSHDLASRRTSAIEAQVEHFHNTLLGGSPSRVLDLGCGPGLYANRLAALGHELVGIDFSPASVAYATEYAPGGAKFIEGDLRVTDYGNGYDLALMLYGEFNVFREVDIKTILSKVSAALVSGGIFFAEITSAQTLQGQCDGRPTFRFQEHGLFHPGPHILLEEAHWHDDVASLSTRYSVIDVLSNEVRQYGASYRSYIDSELAALFSDAGLANMTMLPPLEGTEFGGFVVTATKP